MRPFVTNQPLPPAPKNLVPYGSASYLQTQFFVQANTVTQVSPGRPRQYFGLQNNSAFGIYIGFDVQANASNGILLLSNGYLELQLPAPSNNVYVFSPSGDAAVVLLEALPNG